MRNRILIFLVIVLSGVGLSAQDNVIDEVVWIVRDDAIWKSEVDN